MADEDTQPVIAPITKDRAPAIGQTKESDQRWALHVRVKNPSDFPGGGGGTANAFDVLNTAELSIPDNLTEVEAKKGLVRLVNRNGLYLENTGTTTIYYGPTGVTSSGANRGAKLFPNQHVFLCAGDVGIFLITDDAGGGSFVCQEFGVT